MSEYTMRDCRSALRACERLVDDTERSHAERDYWRNVLGTWQRRLKDAERDAAAHDKAQAMLSKPSAVQVLDDNLPSIQREIYQQVNCPDPVRWGVDELKCMKCGHLWASNEEKPPCTL